MRGEGCFRDEPSQSPAATASSPFCRLAGEVAFGTNPLSRLRRQLSRRESPWQRGQVSSLFVNGRKKPADKRKTFRLCQSLSLSGEVARRSRDGEGCFRDEPSQSPTATASSPFCRLAATSSPGRGKSFEGRALGRTSKFRPHRSTAGRSLPLSSKLFAPAKASPFRERWHGEAVTERVVSKTPSRRLQQEAAARCIVPPTNTKSPPESSPAGF